MTLASIVEAEARVAAERPVIASVYHNRLKRGMLLEADPTVQYALGGHRERVLYSDLEVDSPYNTYRNPGLPPGPIGSPGRASLEAAAAPDSTPYLFFFWIGPLGTHVLTRPTRSTCGSGMEMGGNLTLVAQTDEPYAEAGPAGEEDEEGGGAMMMRSCPDGRNPAPVGDDAIAEKSTDTTKKTQEEDGDDSPRLAGFGRVERGASFSWVSCWCFV